MLWTKYGNACFIMQTLSKFNSQNGRTPLYWASSTGHTAVVKILMENNADINICNKVNIIIILQKESLLCSAESHYSPKLVTPLEACMYADNYNGDVEVLPHVYWKSILNIFIINYTE